MATTPSYTLPTLTPGYQVTAITSSTIPDFSNLIQNNQPFIRGTFFGVFGAGDFVNIINASGGGMATLGSVLGQSTIPGTTAGYVVAANGQRISTMNGPQGTQTVTNCSPCVILGLTPSVLAQFTTTVPWSGKSAVSFPNSAAPSSIQFGNTFNLSLSAAQIPTVAWSGPTLLDTGTANTILHGPPGISAYQSNQPCGNPPGACANNGTTLSVAGAVPGGAVSSQTTLDPVTNGSTYTVTLKTPLGIQVVGIPFFLQNSVLFDLNGQAVGYTSNFVTDTPIVTPLTVSSSSVPLGLAGVISGTGGVSITAGGSATLTAANTYKGPTIVSAGGQLFLAGPGSIASSSLTVDGLVAGSGTLGPTTVNPGGMLAPGNGSAAVLSIAGNLLLNPGSMYLTSVAGNASSSASVKGTASLSIFQPGSVAKTYTLLSAAGGRTGTFDGSATIGLPSSLGASLGYTATDVTLNISSQIAQVSGLTPNETAAGRGLDSVFNGNGGPAALGALDNLYLLSSAGLAVALNQLSGQSFASEQTVLSNQALYSRDAILARLRQAGYATSAGPQAVLAYAGPQSISLDDSGDPLANAGSKNSAPPSTFPLKAPLAPADALSSGTTFWAQGMGGWGKLNGNTNAAGTTGNFAGVLSGADVRLANNWLVGFALGYTGSSTNVSALASSAQVDTGLIAAYAGTSLGAWNLRLGGTYGINSVYTSRQIAFPGFMDHDTARFTVGTGQVFGEVGYGAAISSVAVEPFADLAYVHLDTAGFTENGGISALSASAATQDTGYSSIGLRAATAYRLWNGMILIPRASVA